MTNEGVSRVAGLNLRRRSMLTDITVSIRVAPYDGELIDEQHVKMAFPLDL